MTKTDTWQTQPLVREGAPKRQDSNFGKKKKISGQMSQIWASHHVTSDWPSVAMWLWLWYSWISKKPLTLHDNLACSTSYLNYNFRPVSLNLLPHFFRRVLVKGEMSTPRYMQAGVPQGSVLSPTLYTLYINDTPQTPGVNLALFADDTCLHATDRKEG
jgi:hypothetical protein